MSLPCPRDRRADMSLPCPRDRRAGERASVRSDASFRERASWTESERELKDARRRSGAGEVQGDGLREEEAEPVENILPEKAAQVFSPALSVPHSPSLPPDTEAFWEMSPFLSVTEDYDQHGRQCNTSTCERVCLHLTSCLTASVGGDLTVLPVSGGRVCPGRDSLKVGVSLTTSAFFFPLLVWGGFVFLPFDAPLVDGAPLRLVYALRCSVFAATPVLLGWLVLGISRFRSGDVQPLCDDAAKEAEFQEVGLHRRFVSESVSLFLIYFLQQVVMAMYLSQEQLKLIPLLAIVFALGRLLYWAAATLGSSVRGFGFGLSFLPSVAMMAANIYFIFMVESAGSFFALPLSPGDVLTPPTSRRRFWG